MPIVTMRVELSNEFVDDVFNNALATADTWGWARVIEITRSWFRIADSELSGEHVVTPVTIVMGIQRVLQGVEGLHPSNSADTCVAARTDDSGYIDATQCDYIVQAALFNEVRYS